MSSFETHEISSLSFLQYSGFVNRLKSYFTIFSIITFTTKNTVITFAGLCLTASGPLPESIDYFFLPNLLLDEGNNYIFSSPRVIEDGKLSSLNYASEKERFL